MAQTGNHKGLQFGIFLAPFHRVGDNPTLGMRRDMELVEWLDEPWTNQSVMLQHGNSLGDSWPNINWCRTS